MWRLNTTHVTQYNFRNATSPISCNSMYQYATCLSVPTSLDVFVHVRQSHLHFPSIRITPLWHQSAQHHCQLMIVVYCDVRATSHPLVMICTLNFLQNVPTVKLWGEVRFPLLHPCNVFTAFWANGDASPTIQSVQLRWDGLVEIGGKSDHFSKKRGQNLLLFHFIPRVKGLAKGLLEKTEESFSSPRPDFIMSRGEERQKKVWNLTEAILQQHFTNILEIWIPSICRWTTCLLTNQTQRPYYNNIS